MNKTLIWVIVILTLAVGVYVVLPEEQGGGGFLEESGDVFCNQYSFTCCREKLSNRGEITWNPIINNYYKPSENGRNYFFCPLMASKCVVDINSLYTQAWTSPTATPFPSEFYRAKTWGVPYYMCTWIDDFWTQVRRYKCDGEQKYRGLGTYVLEPGESLYIEGDTYLEGTYEIYREELIFTGRAGSDVGVPVPGADGCKFVTESDIYDQDGKLIRSANENEISYTVEPGYCVLGWSPGDRTVCGSTEEECQTDDDCKLGHSFLYTWNGKTYGAECYGRTIQLYGCKKEERSVCQNLKPDGSCIDDSPMLKYNINKCEVVMTLGAQYGIECCPGSNDCGSNAFCDPATFTCKGGGDIRCSHDWECGNTIECDRNKKKLVKPVCVNPGTPQSRCEMEELRSVECCVAQDCPDGWYCDSDKKCKEGTADKDDCPFACCVGEEQYFDKPCASGICCPRGTARHNTCAQSLEQCGIIDGGTIPKNIPTWIFALVGFLVGFAGGMRIFKRNPQDTKPFYKQMWFWGSLIMGVIFAIVLYMLAPTILQVGEAALPTFNCPQVLPWEQAGCWVLNFLKLFIWIVVILILIKFVI